jgi:uncharacterized protein with ParB-like and HNH nuclease domain
MIEEHLLQQLADQKRKVDFNTYDISVKELISMVSDKLIDIAPEYQRQFRWKEDRQSILVESIFLGIPIPSLFMATNQDGSWELIDGLQRLSSIVHFAGNERELNIMNMNDKLVLQQLQKLTQFNEKTFDALPKSAQLDFLLKPIKVTTLSDKSDKNVRFDLFERLNTGGIKLTDQEIRSCIFRGKFNDTLKELARNKSFMKCVKLSREHTSDGTKEELVLRYFAFYHRYKEFDHSVIDFLNNYMRDASVSFNYEFNVELFENTFENLAKIPKGITRGRAATPINLFEAVAVGAALALHKKGKIKTAGASTWIASDALKKLTTGATNSKKMVAGRIEFCYAKFAGN